MVTICNPEDVSDEDIEDILASSRGLCLPKDQLVCDEGFQSEARSFVRSKSCIKGEPNLTVSMFQDWVLSKYKVKISDVTAWRWLHRLGFSRKHHQKGVYFDGHDRDNVVVNINKFLECMKELDKKTLVPGKACPVLGPNERPLIRVVHDESTYYANCDQSYFWGDNQTNVLKQKSLGSSIMVSDFIDEINGFVRSPKEEACLVLDVSKDGYFNNSMLLKQVDKTIKIFEEIYPEAQALFLFDNAPSHKKIADNVPNADKMNVGPGGKQPVMRDTVWGEGNVQKLVLDDGTPKGLKLVLEERGISTIGMNASTMRQQLKSYQDFQSSKTILEQFIEDRGHLCFFLP